MVLVSHSADVVTSSACHRAPDELGVRLRAAGRAATADSLVAMAFAGRRNLVRP